MMRWSVIGALLISLASCVVPNPNHTVPMSGLISVVDAPVHRPLKAIMDSLGWSEKPISLHVDKSERHLEVLVEDSVLKRYTVVLGLNPEGDKQFQGDKKTPEGLFGFRAKYPHKEWHKFVWIDYPNAESWRRFNERKSQGSIPAESKIGGEIGIHGVPKGMDHWIVKGEDWTFGCIAMRNDDLDEIYPLIIPQQTRLEIVP